MVECVGAGSDPQLFLQPNRVRGELPVPLLFRPMPSWPIENPLPRDCGLPELLVQLNGVTFRVFVETRK